ncbi:MAG: FAD-dependent oxidoreductase [Thaumarchaeota archaeon]|jgi:heterodisulfide reductase subunit A|nr:FAD-dependent oxidoreductase [Candidatus Geocrenenecus arthurdayi]MCL7396288.1 FAD-dependent oxidoreductase [Candidatus Geocrenenecus arthurdayi]
MSDEVLVIGGGIAGIQCSLDLANAGVKVVLVEKTPTIGGKMAILDKNFPTLDCSICIEAPKMSEVGKHPNIELLTLAEVVNVEKDGEDYIVEIYQKPRYVTDECSRCGLCVDACPVLLKNEFDYGMAARKAIYTPIPQSEPGAYVIDIDNCLNKPPNYLPCDRCIQVCGPKCIDFFMKPKIIKKKVKAIVVATGFEVFDVTRIPDYSYGLHPDILTSIEYERLLQSTGPSGGEIIKPSNGRHPENICFVLCVGSRDPRYNKYCSRFCCMYTIKEAVQTVEHGIKNVDILYMDIRAYGKGFDGFYKRAKDEGVRFIKGRAARVIPNGDKLKVRYENIAEGRMEEKEYDMVVLAAAAEPPPDLAKLANILGIELDEDGFIKTRPWRGKMISTTREGIFVCGSASGPKDIADSVTEAGAAASAALEYVKKKTWPKLEFEETIPAEGETRVGVFICHCGTNIAGVADVKWLAQEAAKIPGVVHSEDLRFACAGVYTKYIEQVIREKNINRLVVAACSPRTHLPVFTDAAIRAGLNPYLVEMANIRNLDTWVHAGYPKEATEKALDMIKMAVAKAKLLKPLYVVKLPVTRRALVIGGGVAGMAAAASLARQGFETYLVEKENQLGGLVRHLDVIAPEGIRAQDLLYEMEREVYSSGVKVILSAKVESVSGYIGNFIANLSNGEKLEVGAIVMATGAKVYQPQGVFQTNGGNIMTSFDLEQVFKNNGSINAKNVVFISCVGSRYDSKGCSRFCCQVMIKQAIRLREMGKNVFILYKDIRTYSRKAEELYEKARALGVRFVKYDPEKKPEEAIKIENGLVYVKDELLGEEIGIPADLVVLNVGLVPNDEINPIVEQLKLSRDEAGFLLELHPKLGPVESMVGGVFLAGTSQNPKDVREAISQGLAAAAKAAALLAKETIDKEPLVPRINYDKCTYCQRCAQVCTFSALRGELRKSLELISALCQGCGNCAAECMVGAIEAPGFTDEQIIAQIDAALEDRPNEKAIVFTCNWCSYAGADQAGIEKLQYPPSSRVIRTMCSARISQKLILRAFEKGAAVVAVTGCWPQDCHYNYANLNTERRVKQVKKILEARGINPERLILHWNSAAESKRWAAKMKEIDELIKKIPREEIIESIQKLGGGRK